MKIYSEWKKWIATDLLISMRKVAVYEAYWVYAVYYQVSLHNVHRKRSLGSRLSRRNSCGWTLWKIAQHSKQELPYDFCGRLQIGHRYPELYVNWAAELESMRRWEEAEKVLEDGMSACSGNVEYLLRLQSVKKGVLDRDARWILDNEVYTEEPEDERDALGGLRPVDKEKKVAPINRVGDSKLRKYQLCN